MIDYYKRYSTDGGVTWGPNVRVSDVSTPVPTLNPNFDPIVATCYYGDYDQQVQDEQFTYILWSDSRNTQNAHPDPDIWFEKELTFAETGILSGTVYDDGTLAPIPNALVEAQGPDPLQNFQAITNIDGDYDMVVVPETYEVTAFAYGYDPNTITGVTVISGTVTTQDIPLTAKDFYVVEGTVTDINTGWPLYAKIDIVGYPGSPIWTDPVTGYYSVLLSEDVAYTFVVFAFNPGYIPEVRPVGPLTSDTVEDFALDIDVGSCITPGYEPVHAFFETFESGFGNWTMTGLWNPEAEADPCGSLVAPFPSPSNDVYYGQDGVCTFDTGVANSGNLTMVNPVSLPPSGSVHLRFTSFEETECGGDCAFDNRYVEISDDGGGSWDPLGEGWLEDFWYEPAYNLSPYLGQNVLIRFRFDSVDSIGNGYFGWMVDDVRITTGCEPVPGGLVVGNVYDDNTGDPLFVAEIRDENGELTPAMPTPSDPNVDDGFYSLFSPAGTHTFTATFTSDYGMDVDDVNVILDDVVWHDFEIPAGFLNALPDVLDVPVLLGTDVTVPMTLTNFGGLGLDFEIREHDKGYQPPPPLVSIPASDGNFPRGDAPPSSGPAPIAANPDGVPLASPLLPLGTLAYSYEDVNDFYTQFDLDMPDVLPNLGPFVPTGFPGAGEYLNGYIYIADTSNNLYKLDPATGIVITSTITAPPGGETYTGFALDPTSGDLYASSTNVGTSSLFLVDVNTGVSTLIGPITNNGCNIAIAIDGAGQMWGYDICTDVFVSIDKATAAGTVIGSIGFDANFGQGMGWDPDTDQIYLSAFNNGTFQAELRVADTNTGNTSLVGVLGATTPGGLVQLPFLGVPLPTDVPWLSEDPISGTLAATSDWIIDVTFDAHAPVITQTGEYYADLILVNNTPYGKTEVPVTMTVVDTVIAALDLKPNSSLAGDVGTTVVHTLTVTNNGNLIDSFDITFSGVNWTTSGPSEVMNLFPGQTKTFYVSVMVPMDAIDKAFDTATVTATSQNTPSVSDSVTVTTTAIGTSIYLPITFKD
jgi:hypothetical protein